MSDKVWIRLRKIYEEFPEEFGGSIDNVEEINKAEALLNCKFSECYKRFLEEYGSAACFEGYLIHGLKYLFGMGKSLFSVVDKTNFYKEEQSWPGIEDWYIISDDGFGNPIGIDPDGVVWLSDHDSNFEKIKLADNFEEFLEKLLDGKLYE